jgi:hypothetical protein
MWVCLRVSCLKGVGAASCRVQGGQARLLIALDMSVFVVVVAIILFFDIAMRKSKCSPADMFCCVHTSYNILARVRSWRCGVASILTVIIRIIMFGY